MNVALVRSGYPNRSSRKFKKTMLP